MIAAWMIASTLFAALLGVAALAVERALRITERQARGVWLAALIGAVGWTAAAPTVSSTISRLTQLDVRAPIAGVAGSATFLGAAPARATVNWATYLDVPLVALWALASLVLLARLAWAMRALSQMERAADRSVIDGVPVLVTESIGPAVFGTRRARVLVPRWLLELDAPLRELVLRHEQEHCRARDPQLTLTVAIAIALMPWNAGVWWISRRLRLAVELDCDTRVLRAAHDTERYSKLLLFIAQRQSILRLAPMLAESNSHLGRRIAAMNAPRPKNIRARVALFAIIAAGALAYSTTFAAELTAAPSVSLRSLSNDTRAPNSPPGATAVAQQPVMKAVNPVTDDTMSNLRGTKKDSKPSRAAAAPKDTNPAAPAPQAPSLQGITGPGNRVAIAIPGSPAPRYPDILKQAGLGGAVLVAFVVDTSGNVDLQTIRVFVATHQLFADAVKTALPEMHFLPAMVNGRNVKQVVRLPIVFNVAGMPLSTEEGTRAVIEKLLNDEPSSKFMTLGAIVITGIVP